MQTDSDEPQKTICVSTRLQYYHRYWPL